MQRVIIWIAIGIGLGAAPPDKDDSFRDEPPPIPRAKPSVSESDELRRLQAELEALKKSRGEPPAPAPAPAPSAHEPTPAELMAERIKLKMKLFDLIEKIQTKRSAPSPAPIPASEPPRTVDDRGKPVDRLRQVQNLYRSGQVQAAQRAMQLMDPAAFSGRQGAMLKYLKASCHRRAGEFEQAKQLYTEIAGSKEDEFLADCSAWQLQAIKTREELSARVDTTRTPGPNR